MGYPDFVCMGFQKCGTTTLWGLLNRHPQIVLCRDVKEPMYYRVPLASKLGLGSSFYKKRYFGHVQLNDIRMKGEINAGLTFNGCARKLKHHMPRNTRMIFMLRNPVDRSYSAYKYFLARGFLPRKAIREDVKYGHAEGFDRYVRRVLEDEKAREQIMEKRLKYLVLSQSNYGACVEEFFPDFHRGNMKFVLFEEFVRDEHAACLEIFDFLELEDSLDIPYGLVENSGNECTVSPRKAKWFYLVKGAHYLFYDLMAMPYWAPDLYRKFDQYYDNVRQSSLAADMDRSQVLDSTRVFLEDYFDEDVRRMEEICGRDLRSLWGWGTMQ